MLLFRQRDSDHAWLSKHGLRDFLQLPFEVGYIVLLPERGEFLN